MGYIYTITNKINNKIYVGKTSRDPQIRWKEHLTDYRHPELPIQRAFKKYGKDNFIFTIIKEVPDEVLNQEEQYYIDQMYMDIMLLLAVMAEQRIFYPSQKQNKS